MEQQLKVRENIEIPKGINDVEALKSLSDAITDIFNGCGKEVDFHKVFKNVFHLKNNKQDSLIYETLKECMSKSFQKLIEKHIQKDNFDLDNFNTLYETLFGQKGSVLSVMAIMSFYDKVPMHDFDNMKKKLSLYIGKELLIDLCLDTFKNELLDAIMVRYQKKRSSCPVDLTPANEAISNILTISTEWFNNNFVEHFIEKSIETYEHVFNLTSKNYNEMVKEETEYINWKPKQPRIGPQRDYGTAHKIYTIPELEYHLKIEAVNNAKERFFNELKDVFESDIILNQNSSNKLDDYVNQQIQFVIDSLNAEIKLVLENPIQGFQPFHSCRFKKPLSIFDDFVKQIEETIKKQYVNVSVTVQQTDSDFWFDVCL